MEFVLGWDGYNNGRGGGESIFTVAIFDGSGTQKAKFQHSKLVLALVLVVGVDCWAHHLEHTRAPFNAFAVLSSRNPLRTYECMLCSYCYYYYC